MICAKLMLDDDTLIATVWLRDKPAAGEYIWLTGEARAVAVGQFGAGSFLIKEIAHWVSAEWMPGTHKGEPIHSLAIYAEPLVGKHNG